MRFCAQLAPIRLGHVHVIVLRRSKNIRESEFAVIVRHVGDLIEASQSGPDMRGVGERLLPLFRKGEDLVGQVVAPFSVLRTMLGMSLPS